MAVASVLGVEHLPSTTRAQYGGAYAEGMAVAASQPTGDATGGDVTFTVNADGGFLYRLELLQLTRGATAALTAHMVTAHRWAAERAPVSVVSFDLNWFLAQQSAAGFSVFMPYGGPDSGLQGDYMRQIRRFPMGSIRSVGTQILINLTLLNGNVDTITHEFAAVFTYWKKEALYRPGFLEAFHEAPVSPVLVP